MEGRMAAFAGFGLTIASNQNPIRFSKAPFVLRPVVYPTDDFFLGLLSSSYLATEGISNDQLTFFRYPAYDPS
jgi:hypothetical protein